MKRGVVALLLLFALGGVWARHARAGRPDVTVTYYFIPGCSTCAKTEERLRAAVAPYGSRVAFRAVENHSAEGKEATQRYGFGSHGMVVSDNRAVPGPQGSQGPRVDFVEKDHRVYAEHVSAALQRLLPL